MSKSNEVLNVMKDYIAYQKSEKEAALERRKGYI